MMSAKDYCELAGEGSMKPAHDHSIRDKMIGAGMNALEDAFSVLRNGHVFNIFNSESNEIEEFNQDNADHYSQAQCAIVIERVFSELYKYL